MNPNEQQSQPVPGVRMGSDVWSGYLDITEQSMSKRRADKKADHILAVFSFGLGLFGLTGSVAALFLTNKVEKVFSLKYFFTPQPVMMLFCLSGFIVCYAWYRHVVAQRIVKQLPMSKEVHEGFVPDPHVAQVLIDVCTDDAIMLLEDAYMLAQKFHHGTVLPLHIFASSFASSRVQTLFARLGLSFVDMKDSLRKKLQSLPTGQSLILDEAEKTLAKAASEAVRRRRKTIGALDLCTAAYGFDPFLQDLLIEKGINPEAFGHAVSWIAMQEELVARYRAFRSAAAFKPTSNMDRGMTAQATPFLDSVSTDITRQALYGRTGLTVARETETAAVFRAFEGGGKSVVLVGEPGVGKMTIIEGIAQAMVEEQVPVMLQDKRLLKIDISQLVSADGGRGAGERLLYAFHEAANAGNIVLVLDQIHQLIGVSGGNIDLASIIADELSKGYLFALCTTTPSAYTSLLERSVLGPKLERVNVQEPEQDAAILMTEANTSYIEAEHGVVYTYAALETAVTLSRKFLSDSALPEKALTLLKEAAVIAKRRGGIPCWVKKEDINALVEEKTHVPVSQVTDNETEKLLHLEEKIRERVVGQEDAVKAVASAIRRARTAMRSQNRPIANFLFLGPTGVGKTELAKATAAVFFGDESRMIRFDMSEYQTKEPITRLIGGNNEAGLLTEAVRRSPFALVLLDELEKAHVDILNLFLQVMDDGRLTDGLGRTVDFTNTIVIATSNAGTQYIQDAIAKGSSLAVIKEALMETELRGTYRPEFLNRFDDIIVFHPLTPEDVTAIAYLMISSIAKRLDEKNITLEVTDAAIHELATQGYDPKFGARPLRRVMQDKVENALADFLLRGQVGRRDTVILDAGGKMTVKKAEAI